MPVKSKVEISQNFVAFSEYINFTGKTQKKGKSIALYVYVHDLMTFLRSTYVLRHFDAGGPELFYMNSPLYYLFDYTY